MTFKPKHILTKNIITITPGYFMRVVEPALKITQINIDPIIKTYQVATKKVSIYFYGQDVFDILSQAFGHHKIIPNDDYDIIIHAWDSRYNNKYMIPPWDEPGFNKDYKIEDENFLGVYLGGEESLNFYDKEKRIGYFYTNDVRQLPDWIYGAPFRTILHWFFNESDIHLIHGAVIGQHNKSILLTARSGSGKSTTALSCILSGMDYLSDDYIAIQQNSSVEAHSLYQSAKITRDGVNRFPEFNQIIRNKNFQENEKAVLFLSDIFPSQVVSHSSIVAIFIPRIVPDKTRLSKANKIEAMLAIAPTTMLQLPLAETNKLKIFKSILNNIPCYFLDVGPDIRNTPNIIKDFLSKQNYNQ